jgi:excisionase family DNA binding protein
MATNAANLEIIEPAGADEAKLAAESSRLLAACIGSGKTATIRVIDGKEEIKVPVSALRMLVEILAHMAQGDAVTLVPFHAELTTQQAADILNVSRPFLVKMLDEGKLPFRHVGTRRRVLYKDLMDFIRQQKEKQQATLAELSLQAQELGLDR